MKIVGNFAPSMRQKNKSLTIKIILVMETIIKLANEKETEKYIMFCIKSGFKFKAIGRTKVLVTF